jgi:hypothetical protein
MSSDETPLSTPPPNPHEVRDFLVGPGFRLIPGGLALIQAGFALNTPASNPVAGFIPLALYAILFIVMLVLVAGKRTLYQGRRLLVAIVVSPVYIVVACRVMAGTGLVV